MTQAWKLSLGAININRLEIGDEQGREVCSLDGMRYYKRSDEMFANAKLIASAPKLLAACRFALVREKDIRPNGQLVSELERVIKEATGESI